MAQIQADLQVALEELQAEKPFVLIGHSFGGAVASEYAAAHPADVKHLVLIATAGEYTLNPFYRLLLKLPPLFLRSLGTFTRGWLSRAATHYACLVSPEYRQLERVEPLPQPARTDHGHPRPPGYGICKTALRGGQPGDC
jgi:pimeloyl-ACP methyl ester carboxylesterase